MVANFYISHPIKLLLINKIIYKEIVIVIKTIYAKLAKPLVFKLRKSGLFLIRSRQLCVSILLKQTSAYFIPKFYILIKSMP